MSGRCSSVVSRAERGELLAVGYSERAQAADTLVERWNGAAWTIVASVDPVGRQTNDSSGSCAARRASPLVARMVRR